MVSNLLGIYRVGTVNTVLRDFTISVLSLGRLPAHEALLISHTYRKTSGSHLRNSDVKVAVLLYL